MIQFTKILLHVFFILFSFSVTAQNEIEYSKIQFKTTLGNHNIGLPGQISFNSFNPSINVGLLRKLNKNKKYLLFATSSFGGFINQSIGSSLILDIGSGYRYTHKVGLYIELELDIGGILQFHPRDIYKLDPENGTYIKKRKTGKLATVIGYEIGVGYDLSNRFDLPYTIGISNTFFIQSPYFKVSSFPIMPQSINTISITYKFNKL